MRCHILRKCEMTRLLWSTKTVRIIKRPFFDTSQIFYSFRDFLSDFYCSCKYLALTLFPL